MQIYSPDIVDLHVYPYWKPILERIPTPHCPRTLDLLERAIHLDLSPLNDEQDLAEIELALTKVATQVLD